MEKSRVYEFLESCANGDIQEIDRYDIRRIDDLLGGFKYSPNNPKNGKINIKFDDNDDYLRLFDDNQDELNIMNAVMNGQWEFIDSYSALDNEWNGGYILDYFNEESNEIVNEILLLTNPSLVSSSSNEKANHLSSLFEYRVNDIVSEYCDLVDRASNKEFEESIKKDFCYKLEVIGIFKQYCFYSYFTSVNILLKLFKYVGDYSLDLTDLLKAVIEKRGLSEDFNYADNIYDYMSYNVDRDEFNRSISYYLDKMLDEAKYLEVEGLDAKLIADIFKKYNKDVFYPLPKNKDFSFKISKFTNDSKLEIILKNMKTNHVEVRKIPADEFNTFLSNYELFEQKKLKKIIREALKKIK